MIEFYVAQDYDPDDAVGIPDALIDDVFLALGLRADDGTGDGRVAGRHIEAADILARVQQALPVEEPELGAVLGRIGIFAYHCDALDLALAWG